MLKSEPKKEKTIEAVALSEKESLLQRRTREASGPASDVTKPVPLLLSLVKTFHAQLLYANVLRLVGDCIQFANPALLRSGHLLRAWRVTFKNWVIQKKLT